MRKKIAILTLILTLLRCIWWNLTINQPVYLEVVAKSSVLTQTEPTSLKSLQKIEEETEEEFIVDLTQQELELLYMLVFAEDGIESEESQVAVAATIINRIMSESFPDNFYDVMTQAYAFASVHNGKIYIMTEDPYEVTLDMVPQETKNAVQRALRGEDPTEDALRQEAQRLGLDEEQYAEGGALFFYNPEACSQSALADRNSISVKVSLGLHTFYKVWG